MKLINFIHRNNYQGIIFHTVLQHVLVNESVEKQKKSKIKIKRLIIFPHMILNCIYLFSSQFLTWIFQNLYTGKKAPKLF